MTRRRPPSALILAALLWLSACAVEQASPGPEGALAVLRPLPGTSLEQLPGDWVMERNGPVRERQLGLTVKQGLPALSVVNGEASFIFARRTRAMMLATPFLSWSWNMEPPVGGGDHPTALVVGFHGGDPASTSRGGGWFRWLGSTLPPHDRMLLLGWGDSALQRGNLSPSPVREAPSKARYVVRGGDENTRSWWLETLDLSALYARAWPKDDPGAVQVVFIGVAAIAGGAPAPAHVSGILLSR